LKSKRVSSEELTKLRRNAGRKLGPPTTTAASNAFGRFGFDDRLDAYDSRPKCLGNVTESRR
jgi:hypothetical protein